MNEKEVDMLLDAMYSALDLVRNEYGEGEVTEKLRKAIAMID